MARSNSESESHHDDTPHGKTNGGKKHANNNNDSSRLNAQQQQYLKELNKTHITNNKPSFSHMGNTSDLSTYRSFDKQLRMEDDTIIRKYSHRHHLNENKDNVTLTGDLLNSDLGQRTMTGRRSRDIASARVDKKSFVDNCTTHWQNQPAREMDVMSQFIYKVKHQKKDFKMTFS